MLHGKKIIVVMPAYHAEKTLAACYAAIPHDIVDDVLLVDDASDDATVAVAEKLGIHAVRHPANRGYGGNQKTCYTEALKRGAEIVVMVHPDYQYTPKLIPAMTSLIGNGLYHCVIGSRILGGQALAGGMPWWRYVNNRALTFAENLLTGAKLSEYHSGYRAYSREVLARLPLEHDSDDFVFDNQVLAQVLWMGYLVAEVSCPTRYHAEASSIDFARSIRYGLGCLATGVEYALARRGWIDRPRFPRALRSGAA